MRRVGFLAVLGIVLIPRTALAQGEPMGPEFRVNTYTTSYQAGSSIAAGASGDFVVVWMSVTQDGSTFGIFGQRYASGGSLLGPEFRVNTYTTSGQYYPSVAADASGNFVVVWFSFGQDGSSVGIFGQRYASTGSPLGAEFRVNTFTPLGQASPSVAADPSGNFVIVWHGEAQDGSGYGILGQRYASSGSPLGPEFRINTFTTSEQRIPSVAADASGNFVVVWNSNAQDGSSHGVFGQRYASTGAPLGPEFRINTYSAGVQYDASVAADTSGNFVVVWTSEGQDGSGYGIFGQRYANTGAPLGPEFRANSTTTDLQRWPSVSADASGNFVVVWSSYTQDGSYFGVFGQRYASSGGPEGPEFRVNTFTTGGQSMPSVASDTAGNFVVVWRGYGDGSGYGIFGQRFGQIVPVGLTGFSVE